MKSKITHLTSVAVFMFLLMSSSVFAQLNTPRGS
jgi:hypothetical protein